MKQGNDKFTLSVNKKIKEEFKRYCELEGLQPSKQIERFMFDLIKKRK